MSVSLAKRPAIDLVIEWRVGGFEPYLFSEYGGEPPKGGESCAGWQMRPMFAWQPPQAGEYVLIPFAADVENDTVRRSNYQLMTEAHEDWYVQAFHGGDRSSSLYLPATTMLSEPRFDWLVSLATEYSCIDEMHVSQLESEMEWEAWDQWLGRDVMSELRTLLDDPEWLDTVPDDLIRQQFYEINGEQPEPYNVDSSGVNFPHQSDTVAQLSRVLRGLNLTANTKEDTNA